MRRWQVLDEQTGLIKLVHYQIVAVMVTLKMHRKCQNYRPQSILDCNVSVPALKLYNTFSSHLSPLPSEVVGAPQMTLQQYLSTLPCLPLPSGSLQTTFPSIPWCCLPISSCVFFSSLLISLSPAELSSPCPRILRCCHTIWVSVSLPWLGDHHAFQLHSGFCCEPPRS